MSLDKQNQSDDLVYIVIVNWNGWKDTLECLESVFRLEYSRFRVIVCDNKSSDGSLEYIKAWAEGRLDVFQPQISPLRHLSFPPVPKSIPYQQFGRTETETGRFEDDDGAPLVLIQTGANLGFAGGNNVAIRYALKDSDCNFVWLLNNDTVVDAGALGALVGTCNENASIGMCGSTMLYYDNTTLIQAQGGGTYNKWLGVGNSIGNRIPLACKLPHNDVVARLDFVHGASMLVPCTFIRDIGLMNESYFLYYEETDWALRSAYRYALGYSENSLIYHKEGASIGSKFCDDRNKKFRSEYYLVKNRIKFTEDYFPAAMPTVMAGIVLSFFARLLRFQFFRAILLIRVIWSIIFSSNGHDDY